MRKKARCCIYKRFTLLQASLPPRKFELSLRALHVGICSVQNSNGVSHSPNTSVCFVITIRPISAFFHLASMEWKNGPVGLPLQDTYLSVRRAKENYTKIWIYVEVKVVPWHANTCTEGRRMCSSNIFAPLALGSSGWSAPHPGHFIPGKDLVPILK